jgi:hypothetical protein
VRAEPVIIGVPPSDSLLKEMTMRLGQLAVAAALLLCVVAVVPLAVAQEDQTGALKEKVDQTIDTASQTQGQLDEWANERAQLEARYRAAKANIFYLEDRLEVENLRGGALDEQVNELQRRLEESTRLNAVITDTLRTVLVRLEEAIAADLPFLREEREHRLESLRRQMAQPEIAPAENLRRLLEALLIEAKYGETIEVTKEQVPLDGEPTLVDILRIGRIAMFWQTPDGVRTGTYDPATESYVDLPAKHRRNVKHAMEMAQNMRVIELLSLPLGTINAGATSTSGGQS